MTMLSFHRHTEKNENWLILLSHCRYFDRTFLDTFVEQSSINHIRFIQIPHFDLLLWQLKG